MMRVLFIYMIVLSIYSCKDEPRETVENDDAQETNDSIRTVKQSDGLVLFTGKFIYYSGAAVLQSGQNMYGVIENDKMYELDKLVQQYKTDETDFVPVSVRGILRPKEKGTEGWDYLIEIKEILEVYKPNPEDEDVIKLG